MNYIYVSVGGNAGLFLSDLSRELTDGDGNGSGISYQISLVKLLRSYLGLFDEGNFMTDVCQPDHNCSVLSLIQQLVRVE